jgi:hypothetical protein
MKRMIGLVAVSAALSMTAVAFAGNGATTTQFKAAYQLTGSAFATCSGVNISKSAPKAVNKDSETCLLSGDDGVFPLGTTVYGPGVWNSDSAAPSASAGLTDQTLTVTKTLNADGTTYTLDIVATY